jgi:hypothetical protein
VTVTVTIDQTLEERGTRYGEFADNANVAQGLKNVMHDAPRWDDLAADQKEGLEIIASKISRMLTGDPQYRDNWHDIVGYAKLVDDRMALTEAPTPKAKRRGQA